MKLSHIKHLKFISNSPGSEICLYLTFGIPPTTGDTQKTERQKTVFWKCIEFPETGQSFTVIKYTGVTAFGVDQIDDEEKNFAGNSQICRNGQKCEIIEMNGRDVVDTALAGDPNMVRVTNKTDSMVDIDFGLTDVSGTNFERIYHWKNIPSQSSLKFSFMPVLFIYATKDIIQPRITNTGALDQQYVVDQPAPVFCCKLDSLEYETVFSVSINPQTVVPDITRVETTLRSHL